MPTIMPSRRTFINRDVSNRVFPGSGSNAAFHTGSHHLDRDERIADFQKINTYHVGLVPSCSTS